MREIKFRGKSLRTGKWVYGSLVQYGDGRVEIYTPINPRDENSLRAWLEEVDPATVGQYTGLKDKNGKEIYEGDMLRKDEYFISYVKYCTPSFYRVPLDKWSIDHGAKETVINWGTFVTSEVIGNIYDNPEY